MVKGDQIKPCPYCGSSHVKLTCSGSSWFVECLECEASGPMIDDGVENDTKLAIEAWDKVAVASELVDLMNKEYSVLESLIGNGCEHGFKPASECPNTDCRESKINRLFDTRSRLKGSSDDI